MEEQATSNSTDMKFARLVINKFDETVENFQSNASSILSLTDQWRSLQSSFSMAEASIASRARELESKERECSNFVKRVENLQVEVDSRRKNLEVREKSASERLKEVELREKIVREIHEEIKLEKIQVSESRKMLEEEVKERYRVLEERENEIVERNRVLEEKMREKELDDHCKSKIGFEFREKEIEEREEELNLREKQIKERGEELRLKEKEVNEGFLVCRETLRLKKEKLIESRRAIVLNEKRLNEQCAALEVKTEQMFEERKVLELKEKEVIKSCERLELMKKEVDHRCVVVELKEKELRDGLRALELTQKELDECFRTEKSKEKEMSEGLQALELKEKQINESREKLELRDRDIDECYHMVQLKEKKISESFKELDLIKKEVDERSLVVEQKEEEINYRLRQLEMQEKLITESRKGLELIEKEVDGRFRAVELKEREMSEGLQALDLKEKQKDETHKGLELIERELDERFQAVELKEKEVSESIAALELSKKQLNEDYRRLKLKELNVDESLKIMELGEKHMDDSVEALEMKVKQLEDCCQGIELKHHQAAIFRERQLNAALEALENKAKEIEECCKVMELKENQLKECFQGVDAKEKQMGERIRALDLREQKIQEHYQTQESKEKEIDEQCQALKLKEKQIDERCQSLELKEKQINESSEAVELKERQLNEGLQAFKLKERQIDENYVEMELKKKEIIDRFKALEVKEKQIKRRQRVLNLREQQSHERCQVQETEDKQIDGSFTSACSEESGEIVKFKAMLQGKGTSNNLVDHDNWSEAQIIQLCIDMNGKALQLFLNERVNEHESMMEGISNALKLSNDPAKLVLAAVDGFFLPHSSNKCDSLAYEVSAIRKSCVLLLELVMNIKPCISEAVRKEAAKVANEWRDKMRVEGESDILVLGFLLFLVTYDLWSDFEKKELQRLYKTVGQHRVAPQLCLRLGISKMMNGSFTWSQVESREPLPETSLATSAVASSSISQSNDIQSLCGNMDTIGVRSYLIQHVKEFDTMEDMMLEFLWLASDPAKLVLDVIQSFYELKLEEVSVGDFTSTCMFLLVLLMKLKADISSHVRDEATKFADIWRFLLKQGNTPRENLGFLQYLASYKLAESYDADELLSLFITFFDESEIYQPEKNPYLCHALGLSRKIPDLIRSLIMSDKQLLAVRYICALKMEDAFPPVPLLREHMINILKRVEEILRKGSTTAKDDAANMELTGLKAVVKCICDFKLESSYSPISLEFRIKQLEKRKERKSNAHLVTLKSCSNLERKASDTQSEKKRSANFKVPPKEEKRPRAVAHHMSSANYPNLLSRQPAHVFPYGCPIWQYQTPPSMSWPEYNFGASHTMYGIPYDRNTGEFGVAGIYPAGAFTSTINSRSQAHRTARCSDSITVQTYGYKR
ncbi:hypothetical protein BVRB_4g082990 [Beta vulgaris subsp. vulgaris]|nr:hypothetical protein BVRB_4g082990 [Beta vulgaris subsp. vulgaris]